jgi:flagellar FliL protein
MAEESGQGEAGSGATAPAGRGKLLLIVAAVVLLAGGGGAAWWLLGPRGATARPVEEAAPRDPLVGAMLPLDTFIANLADEDGKRYLKASVQVEFFDAAVPHEFEALGPQVRDLLLTLLTSKTFAEVRTPEGKAVLREEIINRMNRVLRKDLVKAVYFTEFIVQ